MKNISGIQAFVKVGEVQSFTVAADRLRQTPSAVSKAVRLLEAELGVQLFHRTTRALSFTQDGILFYERCKQALDELEDARRTMISAHAEPSGKLRLDLPVAFGHKRVVPYLHLLVNKYPSLQLDVTLSDKFSNLGRDGIDVAVRITRLEDSSAFQKKLGYVHTVLCASPEYLARAGVPRTVDDLKKHETVTYLSHQTPTPMVWKFEGNGKVTEFQPNSRLRFNTGDAIMAALTRGAGIGSVFDFMVKDEFQRGTLVPVLPELKGRTLPVSAIYLPHRQLSPKTRVCLDFLAEIMEKQ